MKIRPFDSKKDLKDVYRIWREVGWIEGEKNDEKGLAAFLKGSAGFVAEHAGAAECAVFSQPGTIRYLASELPFSCVTAVTTSRIARRLGLAGGMTASLVRKAADEGALVAGLGMFEQGFYDKLGFGSGNLEHIVTFRPADLMLPGKARIPVRLGIEDADRMHRNRLGRMRRHGACRITSPGVTQAEAFWTSSSSFGLGYEDENGELTHHVWFGKMTGENGPLRLDWLAFRTWEEFRELLLLIKGLGDQVWTVAMLQPAGVQIQDLIRGPIASYHRTKGNDHVTMNRGIAWWQMRMVDVAGCFLKTSLACDDIAFQLRVTDPIAEKLDDAGWRGVAGDYIVKLGSECRAEAGRGKDLPVLETDVGSLTRMWLGVLPASGLAAIGRLKAPDELLAALDRAFALPEPKPDWSF